MEYVDQLVAQYGLVAVFLGCFLEGESIAVTAGVLAHRHLLVFPQVVAAVTLGAWCADVLFFWIGRRYRKSGRIIKLTQRRGIDRVLAVVAHGPKRFAAMFRFIPGMRILGPLVLAQSPISFAYYAVVTLSSSIIWALIYTTAGHFLGGVLVRLFGHGHRTDIILVIGTMLFVVGMIVTVLHLRRRGQKHPN